MADLTVIVPSRGRPQAMAELIRSFVETCTADTHLVIAVDADDPALSDYHDLSATASTMVVAPAPSTMVKTLNYAARMIGDSFAVAFMGDDHRPRTVGWDSTYLNHLRELGTGIVYGNDLLQGERIPTQAAMTADIVRALGHMAPDMLAHLFVDNYWRDLGTSVGCLRYLPEVVVEHLHPFAGKAPMDEGYHRVNAPSMYGRDRHAYSLYVRYHLFDDIVKVKALR